MAGGVTGSLALNFDGKVMPRESRNAASIDCIYGCNFFLIYLVFVHASRMNRTSRFTFKGVSETPNVLDQAVVVILSGPRGRLNVSQHMLSGVVPPETKVHAPDEGHGLVNYHHFLMVCPLEVAIYLFIYFFGRKRRG